MLTSQLQLVLAHYCDTHGPTPLIVTEGSKVPCSSCFDTNSPVFLSGDNDTIESPALEHSLRRLSLNTQRPWSSSDDRPGRSSLLRSSTATTTSSSTSISPSEATPPESPRRNDIPRRDSGFRRTYDEHVTRRAGPCDNCALTVPPNFAQATESDEGRGPVLRSKIPYSRPPSTGWNTSPPSSRESAASDSEADEVQPRNQLHRNSASRSSMSSASRSSMSGGHLHYMKYISTKEPMQAASFAIVRASCLRTLSFETLPRGPPSHLGAIPGFVATHTNGYAASGGPIFFGDPVAGYTTAYIFRISDVHARGHKRVYAFLAISTHRERQVMQQFEYLARRFRQMAASIQQMADIEAEKASDASSSPILGSGPFAPQTPGAGAQQQQAQQQHDAPTERPSSFLGGGSGGGFNRRMGAGGPSVSLKARGLAELVGQPDFFYQMHCTFAKLLYEIDHNKYI
ncbi:hypothetical protein TD95_000525 [Thielaviopsis punctulata]|uniref:UDENN FLCN/SMCR8-type domain-containing protein n=1 Tax=Thielaviopsis punctulata TaxID=72032 RepID=A0A0F4Z9Z6_9PEZI|nr:hypothetical protein TD95_000525 [Thielaviopsis punctulata]